MRPLRTTLAAAALAALAPCVALAQPSAAKILQLAPTVKGVEMDAPIDKALAECKVERVVGAGKRPIGWALRDGQGQLLRRVFDNKALTDAAKPVKTNQWSYYKDGFEVYRDLDTDGDEYIDEARFLNSAGTRVAAIKANKVVGWKRLSAEEASKVFVQGLTAPDLGLIESVLATPEDLAGLGLPKAMIDHATAAVAERPTRLKALSAALSAGGWNKSTAWYRFDVQMPHAIPADASADLKADVQLYENAAVFASSPAKGANPLELPYLQVGELVKVGEVWKLADLPNVVDAKDPKAPPTVAGIRSTIYRESGGPAASNPAGEAALSALALFDKQRPEAPAEPKAAAEYYRARLAVIQKVVDALGAAPADERFGYEREAISMLAMAYQTGQFKEGGDALDRMIGKGGKLGTYADYRKILADFSMESEKDDAKLLELQKGLLARLEAFVKGHPTADEAPDALYQIATGSELFGDEKEARAAYGTLAKDHADTDPGKKAAGALRRLDLVGQPIELAGTSPAGKPIDARSFKGKPLLVVFWSGEGGQFQADLDKWQKAIARQKDLAVLGVNLDADKASREAFIAKNDLKWYEIREEGGLDRGPLANAYGILTLPTVFLVDAQGKVIGRGLKNASEIDKLMDRPVAAGRAGAGASPSEVRRTSMPPR